MFLDPTFLDLSILFSIPMILLHIPTHISSLMPMTLRASLTLSSARTFWQQLRFRNVEPSRSHFRRTIDNRINMNSLIFQHTVFSTNARHFNRTVITFQDSPISTSDNIKYLGVYIDTRLTWKPRITFLRNRSHTVNRQLWWLMGRHSKLNQALKILICKATIKPT